MTALRTALIGFVLTRAALRKLDPQSKAPSRVTPYRVSPSGYVQDPVSDLYEPELCPRGCGESALPILATPRSPRDC